MTSAIGSRVNCRQTQPRQMIERDLIFLHQDHCKHQLDFNTQKYQKNISSQTTNALTVALW